MVNKEKVNELNNSVTKILEKFEGEDNKVLC